MRVAGRVRWGKGTGSVFLTLAIPVPSAGVGGLPMGLISFAFSMERGFSEFESRSTMTNAVDLTFHHSHNMPLDSMNAAGCVKR